MPLTGLKVGFLGGGAMAGALLSGLTGGGTVSARDLYVSDIHRDRLEQLKSSLNINILYDNRELVQQVDIIILAVKPGVVRPVVAEVADCFKKGQTVISIAAGVTISALEAAVGSGVAVIRVMPNTPALVGGGVSAVCLDDPKLTPLQREMVQTIFASVGSVHVLEEKSFDAFTAVAGSGPAYVFYFIEAMVEAAVAAGLPRAQAAGIVAELFSGSLKLANQSMTHPSLLREMVTSPAGTTIAALMHLDRQAVRASIIDAVLAAKARSEELGK